MNEYTHQTLDNRPEVGHSKFYMFRALIAMAHADGVLHAAEKAYLCAIFDRNRLTDEQRDILRADFSKPADVFEMTRFINDPEYRSQTLYFARLLAYEDGEKSYDEDKVLRKYHSLLKENIDMDTIKKDVHSKVYKQLLEHDAKMSAIRPQGGLFGALDIALLAAGIDLMED